MAAQFTTLFYHSSWEWKLRLNTWLAQKLLQPLTLDQLSYTLSYNSFMGVGLAERPSNVQRIAD